MVNDPIYLTIPNKYELKKRIRLKKLKKELLVFEKAKEDVKWL